MQHSVPLPKNIVLIGFMGCGKSTVGRELQKLLGYELVDMDAVIEERVGKPITRIFSEDGESTFRDMETRLLAELGDSLESRRIIATGGGVVARPENRQWLQKLGYVVWLNAPEAVILSRTRKTRERPLLDIDDPENRVKFLLAEREPWYRESSHLKVDTVGLSSREIAAGILESARYFFTDHDQPPCTGL